MLCTPRYEASNDVVAGSHGERGRAWQGDRGPDPLQLLHREPGAAAAGGHYPRGQRHQGHQPRAGTGGRGRYCLLMYRYIENMYIRYL